MAFILVFVGVMLAYLDYLGTNNLVGAGTVLKAELFTNTDPFYKWAGAIIIIALLGYVQVLRPIATAMLILVILAIVLSHNNALTGVVKAL